MLTQTYFNLFLFYCAGRSVDRFPLDVEDGIKHRRGPKHTAYERGSYNKPLLFLALLHVCVCVLTLPSMPELKIESN